MQKIVNVIALSSGVVSAAVIGLGIFTYVQRDQLIDSVKSKVMDAVSDALPGAIGGSLPSTTGLPTAPNAAPAAPVAPSGPPLGL
tara:strand:- start:2335 stop:2589 length:255 start_codon:yes stop_codon:yes gene_type:complete